MTQDTEKKELVKPKQQRSVASKANIFAAAQQLFSDFGLHGTSVDQIAQAAQVNKQRIYAYFGSKQNLYREVLIDAYRQAAHSERLLNLTEHDIPKMTRIIIETFIDFHRNHLQFWRLLSWENLHGGENLSLEDWQTIRTEYMGHLRQLFDVGRDKGLFRGDVSFQSYMYMLFASTFFYFSNQLTVRKLLDIPLRDSQVEQQLVQTIETVIERGVQGE